MIKNLYPIILSGGAGTRLWPLSRAMYPKQFICPSNSQASSFLAATLRRLKPQDGFSRPIIVCNNVHRFLVKEEVELAGATPRAIILEPVARNTGPAIAAAAHFIDREDPTGILVVMPSDHVIKDSVAFIEAVRKAARVAATGRLVLLGITPTAPHAGYGYIRRGLPIDGVEGAFAVDAFAEKPDAQTAACFLAAGDHYWNSGIFVLGARVFLQELDRLEPDAFYTARTALAEATEDLGFLRLDAKSFSKAPNISVDRSVMERTNLAAVLTVDMGWSDVGSWSSIWELSAHDGQGNAVVGDALLEATANCYVQSERSLVATIGVSNLVIIDTPDALLVADRAKAQDVSRIVARLKQANRKEHEQHVRSYRPWGFLRDTQYRHAFSSEAAAHQTRCKALNANAPPPV